MTTTDVFRAFQFNQMTLTRNLEDVTHEESLTLPAGAKNPINWLVGHILATRAQFVRFLGAEPFWSEKQVSLYLPENREQFEKEPLSITQLKSGLDDSLHVLEKALQNFEPRLNESTGRQPMFGEVETALHRLLFMTCHEAYHAGQIGLTRCLLGKPGMF